VKHCSWYFYSDKPFVISLKLLIKDDSRKSCENNIRVQGFNHSLLINHTDVCEVKENLQHQKMFLLVYHSNHNLNSEIDGHVYFQFDDTISTSSTEVISSTQVKRSLFSSKHGNLDSSMMMKPSSKFQLSSSSRLSSSADQPTKHIDSSTLLSTTFDKSYLQTTLHSSSLISSATIDIKSCKHFP